MVEQTKHEIDENTKFAGFWIRVGAYFIDMVVLLILVLLISFLFRAVTAAGDGMESVIVDLIDFLLRLVVWWIYIAVLHSSVWQATVGKKLLGLKVVDYDGYRISFARATGRYFSEFLSALILANGYMMVGWTRKKQGLHDLIAGTLVIKSKMSNKTFEADAAKTAAPLNKTFDGAIPTSAMRPKRRYLVILGSNAALALLVSGFAGGCASTTLPPSLTNTQRELIDTVRFQASVGVEVYHFPVYSEKLIQSLKATSLFTQVDSIAAFSAPPTFIARVARSIYGTAAIPIWTGISLGLIPTTVEEEHGHAFWLIPYQHPQDSVLIDFSYRGPSTLGWVCIFLNLLPNRTSGDVYTHQRFYDGLAYTVASNASKIRQLYGGSR